MLDAYLFETEDHATLRRGARRFATQHIAPHADAWEEAGGFPRELYALSSQAGLCGIGYGVDLGGAGGDLSHMLVAAEELVLAGHSVGTAVGLGSHNIGLPPVVASGTAAQQARFITPVLRGERIAALAVTEADGGSDVAAVRTTARRDGDFYIINGSKTFITSGCRADFITCAVRTGGSGREGLSLIVIEKTAPGFVASKGLRKMGWWASDTAELSFTDCRVPAANLLGEEGSGFLIMMGNFAQERLLLAGQAVAIATLALHEAASYARQRHVFGRVLEGYQVTRHKLADMATRVAAARAVTGDAVTRHLRGEGNPAFAAMAKNAASDALTAVVDQAVQLHGGAGYMRGTLVERLYRDARLYPIGGGTREIMNEVIGKLAGY